MDFGKKDPYRFTIFSRFGGNGAWKKQDRTDDNAVATQSQAMN